MILNLFGGKGERGKGGKGERGKGGKGERGKGGKGERGKGGKGERGKGGKGERGKGGKGERGKGGKGERGKGGKGERGEMFPRLSKIEFCCKRSQHFCRSLLFYLREEGMKGKTREGEKKITWEANISQIGV